MTYHMVMKFPTRTNVGELRSNSRELHQCYLMMITLPKKAWPKVPPIDPRNFAKPLPHPESIESLIETKHFSNNKAEYKALLSRLQLSKEVQV